MSQRQDISLVGFLEGRWTSGTLEMSFTSPRGGSMLGTVRDDSGGVDGYFEFMRITEVDGVLQFAPYPRGKFAGTYNLTSAQPVGRSVVFSSAEGLREVHFSVSDSGELVAAVEGYRADTSAGRFREQWLFRRD